MNRQITIVLITVIVLIFLIHPAIALEAIDVRLDKKAIDLSNSYKLRFHKEGNIQVTTAPNAEGIVNRIEILSSAGSKHWIVFALANNSVEKIDRLLVSPYFRLASSGFIWPDLGKQHIRSVIPSEGFSLKRQASEEADIFEITLDPGSVITFVAELSDPKITQLILWEPEAYKNAINSFTLYAGIVLGISALLALFLTLIFVIKGSPIFLGTATLAWSVLAYVCMDFGFLSKIFLMTPDEQNIWRAETVIFFSTGLIIFLYTYLHLNQWNKHSYSLILIWLLGLTGLSALAIFAPSEAVGLARISIATTVIFGFFTILIFSLYKFDRAIMLIPAWLLMTTWLIAAFMLINGMINNDLVHPALIGGLVLIMLLISFTVMQHAVRGGQMTQRLLSDLERQALAFIGSGDSIWDWDVYRNKIYTGPHILVSLGLNSRGLNGSLSHWILRLHPDDRTPFKTALDRVLYDRDSKISHDFRIRSHGGIYHWLNIRARPVFNDSGEVIRCMGIITDVTEDRISQERLLQQAVHDNLTGLPNRKLFLDRLQSMIAIATSNVIVRPSLLLIEIDQVSKINESLILSTRNSIFLIIAQRLTRLLQSQDSLARLSGDQFALILLSENDPDLIVSFAESVRKTLKRPIEFCNEYIHVTASIGLVSWSLNYSSPEYMIRDAEIATFQAKKRGGDRIETFRPTSYLKEERDSSIHTDAITQ